MEEAERKKHVKERKMWVDSKGGRKANQKGVRTREGREEDQQLDQLKPLGTNST